MQLELFRFIDKSIDLLNSNIDELLSVEKLIDEFFTNTFSTKDHFMDVKSRVKEESSLKEKIIRNNLFMQYDSPEDLLNNLSDLIGVRIECRFIGDEKRIYREITNLFRIKNDNGLYSSYLNENIFLNLNEEQPALQKNGFQIYKIDGKYLYEGKSYNFELQIKSLVNLFWGEIDHKILYKNFNYSGTEMFLSEIMSSIKENLEMIDRELMMLYNHLNEPTNNVSENVMKEIRTSLSKGLNDIYYQKVRNEFGFPVDFKLTSNTIINYLFMKIPEKDEAYINEFIRILNRLKFLDSKYIDLKKQIEFPVDLKFQDPFISSIGNKLSEIINIDFSWNLFFRILFDLEEGSSEQIITNLLVFLKNRYSEVINIAFSNFELTDKNKFEINKYTMGLIADRFNATSSIKLISDKSLAQTHNIVKNSIIEAVDIWDVDEIKSLIKQKFDNL